MIAGINAIKKSMALTKVKVEPLSGDEPKGKSSASKRTKSLVLSLIGKNQGITNNEIASTLNLSKRHAALTTSNLFDSGKTNRKTVSIGGRFGVFHHYIAGAGL